MLKGKELYDSVLEELPKLDSYISNVISNSYKNKILITNPVTSRNPFASSLLLKVGSHSKSIVTKNRIKKIFIKLIKYYIKNIVYFFFYLTHFFTFKISRLKFNQSSIDKNKELVVIDTFTMIDRIYPKGKFDDTYFGSLLYEIIKKGNRQYVILCLLFGDKPWNLRRRIQTYNILADDGRNFVTEFELMGLYEWIGLFKFILVFPFVNLALAKKKIGEYDHVFRDEIINTLDSVQFHDYVRYNVGFKLKSLSNKKLKVISWYENQIRDMLLYKGIKESGIVSEIYGCQFYTKSPLFTNLYPLAVECAYNVMPDVILVSGRYYLNENPALNIKLGISPRYNYLFKIELDKDSVTNRYNILVLLTYNIQESKRIIKVAKNYQNKYSDQKIIVKLHPNHVLTKPFEYPETWKDTEINLSKACRHSYIVITSGSGSAIEAAIMGCSVIILGNDEDLTLNPMPDFGRGQIWDIVFDEGELERSMCRMSQYRHQNPDKIVVMANELRDMFFTEATEQKYVDIFDL